jgi:hypothetical protein
MASVSSFDPPNRMTRTRALKSTMSVKRAQLFLQHLQAIPEPRVILPFVGRMSKRHRERLQHLPGIGQEFRDPNVVNRQSPKRIAIVIPDLLAPSRTRFRSSAHRRLVAEELMPSSPDDGR